MKFVVKKHVFDFILAKAALAVAVKGGDLILTMFKIDVDEPNLLTVSSTDLSVGLITQTTAVTVADGDSGVFYVPAKKLQKIVEAAIEDSDIVVEQEDSKLNITAGRTKWTISTFDGSDYPVIPMPEQEKVFAIDREPFLQVLEKVKFAVSSDEARPMLQQVFFDGSFAYASDSYRLQAVGYTGLDGLSIPATALTDLIGLLKKSEHPMIEIDDKKNHVVFSIGQDTFSCTKMQAQFPDVRKMMLEPALGNKYQFTVDRTALISAINRVAIAADVSSKSLVLNADQVEGSTVFQLAASDPSGDNAIEYVEAAFEDKDLGRMIGVNYQFLLDLLNSLQGKFVTLLLGEDTDIRLSSLFVKEPGVESVLLQFRV